MIPIRRRCNLAWIAVCAAIIAGLFACTGASRQESRQNVKLEPISVTILFFNDIHGHLIPYSIKTADGKAEVGGVARLATLVENIRQENKKAGRKTFLFIAGDILQGTPLSTTYKGKPDVSIFNTMGVDAMTVGNHEFDFGMDTFSALKQQAQFPFLSANIRRKDSGEHLCDSHAVFPLSEDLALTVIGVTTQDLLITTRPDYVDGLALDDSLRSVRRTLENRKNRGPVILLSHSRHQTDRQIAEALPELDAIIGGHDHLLFSPYRQVNGVPIFQALDNGRYLGRIDLAVDPLTGKAVLESSTYLPVTAEIKREAETDDILLRYERKMRRHYGKKIGQSEVFLDGDRKHVRHEETNLGDFVTDVMRQYTGAEIAFVNSGALRQSLKQGRIILRDIHYVLPFDNEIIRVDLTGGDIFRALSRSVKGTREEEDGGFLQVSGIRFAILGNKAVNVRVGPENRPLDQGRIYSVAVNDYLAMGGDDYGSIFKNETAINTRLPLREVVVDAIRSRGTINAKRENRIVRIDAPQ